MSHTALLRANALFGVTLAWLSWLAIAGSLTDLLVVCQPHHDVSIARVEEFQRVEDRFDDAKLALDLSYDLSPCASWNARAVHAQVTIGYETERRGWNEVTVWDKTATERKEMRRAGAVTGKYRLRSAEERLTGRAVEVRLRWGVTPRAGMMWRSVVSVWNGTMPEEYLPAAERPAAGGGRVPGMP